MARNQRKDMHKYVKKVGFWGVVSAVLAAFTVVYLAFRVRTAFRGKDDS